MRKGLGLILAAATCGCAQEMKAFNIPHMELMSSSYISNAIVHGEGRDMVDLVGAPAGHAFDGLLQRLKNAGYNTIISTMPLRVFEGVNGLTPDGTFYLDAKNNIQVFKDALETVDAYGMKLIPLLEINTTNDDLGWHLKFPDSTINKIVVDTAKHVFYASPTAANPQFDTVYAKLLRRLKSEYQSANLKNTTKDAYPSIWLSYDEYWVNNNLKKGNDAYFGNYFLGRTSLSDQRAIAAEFKKDSKATLSQVYRRVYAQSLWNRLNILQNQYGKSATFYAFANAFITQADDGLMPNFHWDDSKFCMVGEINSNGICPQSGESVSDLPGLLDDQKKQVKAGVIFAPWFYHTILGGGGKRDIEGAAKDITKKGFRMISYSAFDFPATIGTSDGDQIAALRESVSYPRQAGGNNTGFVTAVYPDYSYLDHDPRCTKEGWMRIWMQGWFPTAGIYDQLPHYQIIEYGPSAYSAGLTKKVSGF